MFTEKSDDYFSNQTEEEPKSNLFPLTSNPVKEEPVFNHEFDVVEKNESPFSETKKEKKTIVRDSAPESDLTLEVKNAEALTGEEEPNAPVKPKAQHQLYDPVLDLRNYKYPTLDLLENHGSDKIVQDVSELEENKNQIIHTLRNYDIEIQKIFATVGPTVTLV